MTIYDDASSEAVPPLFKYVPLSTDKQIESARQIVHGETIWFASPDQFNDPQESHFNVSFDGTDAQIGELYSTVVTQQRPEYTTDEIAAYVERMLTEPRLRLELEVIARRSIRNHIRSSHAMLCLGEQNDSQLMWSHYAAGHRGLCIEFNIEGQPEWKRQTRRVHYSKKMPSFDWFSSLESEKWSATLLTKSACWSYEHEWRVIDIENSAGTRELEPCMIKSVTLGAEMLPKYKELVREWLHGTEIQLKGASHRWCEYGVLVADDPPRQDSRDRRM